MSFWLTQTLLPQAPASASTRFTGLPLLSLLPLLFFFFFLSLFYFSLVLFSFSFFFLSIFFFFYLLSFLSSFIFGRPFRWREERNNK
jgi:hypothetical protein